MNNSNPKVTIVIPIYDHSNYLKEAIESALAQTYDNIEIIVVNSGYDSSKVKAIIERHGSKIKYYDYDICKLSAALNFGIDKASGSYFCWMTTGYRYLPNKIYDQVKLLGNTEKQIIVSGWATINENDEILAEYGVSKVLESNFKAFLAFSEDRERLNTSAMLFPVKEFKKHAKFDENESASNDIKLLYGLAQAGLTYKVTNRLTLLRTSNISHSSQSSSSLMKNELDFIISEVIDGLGYEEILSYFNGLDSTLMYYKNLLTSNYYRSKAILIKKIIEGQLATGNKAVKLSITDYLSMLPIELLGVENVDALIQKIKKPSKMKRIMFNSSHWLTGGMERVMSSLFRELSDHYEIFLITPYDPRKSQIEIPDYVTNIKISNEAFAYNFDSVILAYALLLDIDIIIGNTNMFERQLNLYSICYGTKIKTVAFNHEYYFYPYKSKHFYHVVEKRLSAFEQANAVIWPNNFSAALCGEYINNSYVIGNPNKFSISSNNSVIENIILCVGRFNDYVKRIDRIIESFSIILKNVPDAKLILVGKYDFDAPIEDSDNITIRSLIERFNIPQDSYEFTGEVENVQDYYARAKVLMLTSNSEGFGMVLTEAASFGVPAVVNYIPGIEDVIIEGKNGYITKQGDAVEMAARVSEVLSSNKIWENLSKGAIRHARLFDSKKIGKKWVYLIDTLLQEDCEVELCRKLQQRIGYNILDKHKYNKVLANELNEIFYLLLNYSNIQNAKLDELKSLIDNSETGRVKGVRVIYSKALGMPKRIKENVEYEGLTRTGKKIATRSYRIVRRKINE